MALVRAPVVWDMLSMAVHLPDLATVLLPSHNRASGAAGRESVLIQCVQLPPGEGGGEEPLKQIQPNGPFDTDKSSTGHESRALKGLYRHTLTVMCQETKRKVPPFVTPFIKTLCDVTKGNKLKQLLQLSRQQSNLFLLSQRYNLAFGQEAVNRGLIKACFPESICYFLESIEVNLDD